MSRNTNTLPQNLSQFMAVPSNVRRQSDVAPTGVPIPQVVAIPSGPVARDSEFWDESGNVKIISHRNGRNVEFRVRGDLVTDHSAVFAAALKQGPTTTGITFQSPEDVRHLLRAFKSARQHGLGSHRSYFPSDPTFHAVSACIRLGAEFRCEQLFRAAMAVLKIFFTSDLSRAQARMFGPRGITLRPDFGGLDIAISVINLARETGTPSLLPLAFLACTRFEDPTVLLNGFKREDGTRETLSPDDLAVVMHAYRSLHKRLCSSVMEVYEPAVSDQCKATNGERCENTLSSVRSEISIALVRDGMLLYPFVGPWTTRLVHSPHDRNICKLCVDMVTERGIVTDEENWKELPCLLGIVVPGWSDGVCRKHSPGTNAEGAIDIASGSVQCILKDKKPWSSASQ